MAITTITGDSNHSGVERLKAFSLAETASSTAAVRLRKASVSGTIVMRVNLAADESVYYEFEEGKAFEGGVYVEVISGTIEGTLES